MIASSLEPPVTTEERLEQYLQAGRKRFDQLVDERHIELPEHGSWEVALILSGEVPEHSADQALLNLLDSSNPRYTGWPVWLDSSGFQHSDSRPFIYNKGWEALITETGRVADSIDFMRLDPKGQFYLYRALDDDIYPEKCITLKKLDISFPILRTAEAIAVGIAFTKAMGCSTDTVLSFAFRWSKLNSRELSSWVKPERYISPGRYSYQDEVTAYVNVPIDTPLSALSEYVYKVTKELFGVFGGFVLGKNLVEDLTRRLIERTL